jgi:hypothetical protein
MEIGEAIEVARQECPDEYALQYLNSLEASIEYSKSIGREKDAYEVQLLYAYSNMGEWREGKAIEVKSAFKEFLKDRLGDAYYNNEEDE